MAADNKELGQFNLEGIPPAPRGVPQIDVTFDIDANGIVGVSAKDKGTGKEQKITISADGGLSDDDIERMVREAAENEAEDKKRKEMVETRNQADALVYTAEKELKENADKVEAADKAEVEGAILAVKTALEGDDADIIKEKTEALSEALMKIGQAIYEQQQAEAAAAGDAGAADASGDDVVDADFEEVDPEDK